LATREVTVQAVGKDCRVCNERIAVAKGSTVCLKCRVAVHDECSPDACPSCKRPIGEVRDEYDRREATRLGRRRAYAYLFLAPIVGLWGLMGLYRDMHGAHYLGILVVLVPSAICYAQARYLRTPSPAYWAVAGLLFNIFAMVYMLGYADGRGLAQGRMTDE
jgi:hypothetical protein